MPEPAYRKYLEKYAEPEARFARQIEQRYGAALVVPLHGEEPSFLRDLEPALLAAPSRALLIAVVNATDSAPSQVHEQNQRLLRELNARLLPAQELTAEPGIASEGRLGRVGGYDLLLLDRASEGRRLPSDQGVGLARRIGMDLALALYSRQRLESPWLGCTDGDARLPVDYFAQNAAAAARGPRGVRRVALTLPFWHVPGGDPVIDAATFDYELSLRYYTLGLAWAGSPYAYESMGSSMVALAEAYAEVRGFPKREAGEDFYLLDKLAKVGGIHRPARAPIELRARRSERVPFGTGARVGQLIDGRERLTTYHPRVFELLALTLRALVQATFERSEALVASALQTALDPGSAGAVSSALDDLNAFEALRETFGASPERVTRKRRLLTWFDALRTLRFVHLIEGHAGLSRLPLREALAAAPFTASATSLTSSGQGETAENALRFAAFSAEQALPTDVGVENAILGVVNERS